MSRKSTVKPGRSRSGIAESASDGIVGRLIDRAFENPANSGGLLVMALTATAIVSNAMFLQNGRHPEPLFMTRPAPPVWQAPRPAPRAPALAARPDRLINDPPMPRIAPRQLSAAEPDAALAPPDSQTVPPSSDVQLIAEIQRELARVGLYSGAIDGVLGARTEAAISAFQTVAGIVITGRPGADLLTALKQPLPARGSPTAVVRNSEAAAQTAELDRRERERTEMIAAQQRRQVEMRAAENYRIVQAALNRIGYGPIPVDGISGTDTLDAIRRFELDNGMPITGEANDALITRLIAIGAVKPG